jgi:CRP-like cAMP-binding protein
MPPAAPNFESLLDELATRGVASELLRPSESSWHLRTIEANRTHVRRGQRAHAVAIVLEGELSARIKQIEVDRLERGTFVGLAPAITRNGVHPYELGALRRTVVAELPGETLLALRSAGDPLYDALLGLELGSLARRMTQVGTRLASIRAGTFPLQTRRSASVLGRLWRSMRSRDPAGPPLEPLLRALPGLRDASPAVIADLKAALHPCTFAAREVIALEGENEDGLYLIASGQVDVLRTARTGNATLMLAALREGTIFGMVALLSETPRNASCVAADTVHLYKMTREAHTGLGSEASRAWRECLASVLHRQLLDAYTSVIAALKVFETTGQAEYPSAGESLVMRVPTVSGRKPDEPE